MADRTLTITLPWQIRTPPDATVLRCAGQTLGYVFQTGDGDWQTRVNFRTPRGPDDEGTHKTIEEAMTAVETLLQAASHG